MSRWRAQVIGLLLAAPAVLGSPPARAQAPGPRPASASKPLVQALTGQAKADYDAGRTLAGDGDFAGALIKFQSAYDQSKDPRVLWNVAFCEKNLRHYARVIAILQRYLSEGDGYLTDKDRKDAKDLITTLQPFTTSAVVTVKPDGAQVFVDDIPVGTAPLAGPVVLDIGERHVRVVKDGFKPFEKTLPVGGTASVTIDVTLEAEVHAGHLVVNAPDGATLVLDDKPVGTGKVALDVPAGGHQLRVTAPGMRPYQTEVVVQDKETRQLDVMMDKELPPEKPRLRVAVGCDGPEPRGPDDGLVVYLDGPDALPAVNVKKRWDDSQSRNVVEYVEYAVDAGDHTVRVRIPDCESLDTSVGVDPRTGASVSGALPSDTPLIMQGPQGTPGHWRFGAGAQMFSLHYQGKNMTETYQGSFPAATTGFALEVGLVYRWLGIFYEFTDGYGTMERLSYNTNDALPSVASTQVYENLLRIGFRLPLNVVSWNIGPEAGLVGVNIQNVNTGEMHPLVGGWTGFDMQPFCDWGASVGAGGGVVADNQNGGGFTTFELKLFWEPNGQCRRERSTDFGLRAGGTSP